MTSDPTSGRSIPSDRRKLKVGFIVDGLDVQTHVRDLVEWVLAQPGFATPHLIVQNIESDQRRPPQGDPIAQKALDLVRSIEARSLRRDLRYRDHLDICSLAALGLPQVDVTPTSSPGTMVHRFDEADVAGVASVGFDVLVHFGSGTPRGAILSAARLGVIAVRHGDARLHRGTPAGFWEAASRTPATGFVVEQLTDEPDGGNVLLRGRYPTHARYLRNEAALVRRACLNVRRVLARIAETDALPPVEAKMPYSGRLSRTPGLSEIAGYFWRSSAMALRGKFPQRLSWSVAFVWADWPSAVLAEGIEIPNPAGRYMADPFVVWENDTAYCFVEDYHWDSERGSIGVYRIERDRAEWIGTALSEPFHLSFPYVFAFGGRHYMIPETHESRQIRLYETDSFPLGWRLSRVLMENVSAADTMVFEWQGRWWLLTSIDATNSGDHSAELFAFHADGPFSDRWSPHSANPVVIDPDGGRNGGILRCGADLFRVAQRQGFQAYGAGASIRRIVQLDPDSFAEVKVADLTPDFRDGAQGVHHLHSAGGLTVFDFLRRSS